VREREFVCVCERESLCVCVARIVLRLGAVIRAVCVCVYLCFCVCVAPAVLCRQFVANGV